MWIGLLGLWADGLEAIRRFEEQVKRSMTLQNRTSRFVWNRHIFWAVLCGNTGGGRCGSRVKEMGGGILTAEGAGGGPERRPMRWEVLAAGPRQINTTWKNKHSWTKAFSTMLKSNVPCRRIRWHNQRADLLTVLQFRCKQKKLQMSTYIALKCCLHHSGTSTGMWKDEPLSLHPAWLGVRRGGG